MFLHRIQLDPRCREARRDLSDPYQLHSTLCRAFSVPDRKCGDGEFLWRLEPETDPAGCPRILVQSLTIPHWDGIGVRGWLGKVDPPIELNQRLKLDSLKAGQRFRFRLRANPCVTRNGKRLGLLRPEEQEAWVGRKGLQHGFSLPQLVSFEFSDSLQERIDVWISHEQMLRGSRHSGDAIRIFSVLYDGILTVTEPDKFRDALRTGIGHGKAMGLGLLSVAPIA
jgi:CRISPR system Cascade subunit CasE